MKIVADNKIPFLKGVLEPWAEVLYLPGASIGPGELSDAEVLFTRTRTKCSEALLAKSAVKIIGTATIGYDHIDTNYCDNNGITWFNAPGCNSSSVRQYIAAALMEILKKTGKSPSDITLGIIGAGNVGSKVLSFAENAGFRVLINDPPRAEAEGPGAFTPVDKLLSESDIVTLHVPLSAAGKYPTRHMADASFFSKMKSGAWFINTSRGEVMLTSAVKKAISGGWLSGAVLDVWEQEPNIDTELMNLAFIATPHIAGYSADGKANGTSMIVRKLSSLAGLPLTDWYPENIPAPVHPVIVAPGRSAGFLQILMSAVKHTYDIFYDDRILKASPATFEKQRGDYPVRREFHAYSFTSEMLSGETAEKIKSIGFRIS